jgi:hypothetical protein
VLPGDEVGEGVDVRRAVAELLTSVPGRLQFAGGTGAGHGDGDAESNAVKSCR